MTGIEAVSLDLDDTLWDLKPVIRRAEQALVAWLAEHYPAVATMFSPAAMYGLRPAMLARYPLHRHDVSFLRRATLVHCFEEAGCPSAGADDAFDVFYAERNRVALFDDVMPGLEALARRGYRIVALTNGNADLGAVGLGRYFHAVVRAADVKASKPEGAMFQAALESVGLGAPDRMVHVGDDPEADVHGALHAGIRAVWMNRTGLAWPGSDAKSAPPAAPVNSQHHEVTTLVELAELLDAAGQ